MKNLILLIIIAFVNISLAKAAESNDVKVIVSKCSTGATVTAGSGVGFIHDQSGYILTSEHVVSLKSDLCYSVMTEGVTLALRTDVVSSDWAHGLALLRLRSTPPNNFGSLQDTLDFEGHSNNEVTTSGFAQQSDQISVDRARVVINGSVRGGFVANVRLLEMIGPVAEYGMSGGAARNSRTNKVMGLISHQRVFLTPGKPSLVASVGEVSQVQSNHFFVISSHSILTWTRNALSGAAPQFSRISAELVKGLGVIFKQPATSDRIILANKGGDGVGATGDEEDSERPGITVEVTVANITELNQASQARPSFESEWLKSLAHDMLRKQKLEFTHLLTVNPITNEVKLKPILSIAHMIAAISTGNSIPIPKVSGPSEPNLNLQALKAALTLQSDNKDVTKLLEIMIKLIDVKMENPSTRLPRIYINVLENHPGWNDLSDQDFEKAVLAKQFLMSFSVRAGITR